MSDLFNPISRNLGGFAGPTLLTGVVPDPPRSLLGLAMGTILKGTVLGKGADGLTTVATDKGTVSVATNAQLPAGSAVTLEVRNAGGDRLQVLILSVETSSGRSSPAPQPGSQAGGAASTGAAPSGNANNAASQTVAQPSPRPAAPPPIEIVGSSVKAIVVQAPTATSLLPTPDVDIEPFTAPTLPISVPADAAQKAQLLAQARLLVQIPDVISTPPGAGDNPDPSVIVPPPTTGTPATANPPVITTPANLDALIEPPLAQLGGTTLQPEVAARISALFSAASGATATPLPATPVAAVAVAPTATGPLMAQLLAGNTVPAGAAAAPAANPPIQMLSAGTELTLHVVAILPTKGGEIEIAPEAARLTGAAAPLIGKVLGYTRAGHAVIDTPSGLLMMQEKTRLPVGAQVALILEPVVAPPAVALPPITTPQQALLFLSSGWPTLDDLLSVLRGAAPPNDPATPVPPGIPQTGPKLAAGLATAINALRSGEVEKLLGPMLAGRKLPIDKEEMVKRLKEEFTQLSDLAKDRPSVDWRALFLPVYDPRIGLTQINLYYRHNGSGDGENDKKDQGTRFLVDVNFAALGAFQLDGLLRGRRFDLMIRSRSRLSRNQRHDIIGIFENALEVGGCTGGLEFRTVEVFPVLPLDELRQSHDHLTA